MGMMRRRNAAHSIKTEKERPSVLRGEKGLAVFL